MFIISKAMLFPLLTQCGVAIAPQILETIISVESGKPLMQ